MHCTDITVNEGRFQRKDSCIDWDSLLDCQGAQSQKEGQDENVKALAGIPPRCFEVPWASWPSFWLWAPRQSIKLSQSIKLAWSEPYGAVKCEVRN